MQVWAFVGIVRLGEHGDGFAAEHALMQLYLRVGAVRQPGDKAVAMVDVDDKAVLPALAAIDDDALLRRKDLRAGARLIVHAPVHAALARAEIGADAPVADGRGEREPFGLAARRALVPVRLAAGVRRPIDARAHDRRARLGERLGDRVAAGDERAGAVGQLRHRRHIGGRAKL